MRIVSTAVTDTEMCSKITIFVLYFVLVLLCHYCTFCAIHKYEYTQKMMQSHDSITVQTPPMCA